MFIHAYIFYVFKGRIVNVTSNKGRIGIPSNSAFCMTKYGQEGFTDALRMEMKKFGVKVITVEPGNFTGSTAMLSKNKVCTLLNEGKFCISNLSELIEIHRQILYYVELNIFNFASMFQYNL